MWPWAGSVPPQFNYGVVVIKPALIVGKVKLKFSVTSEAGQCHLDTSPAVFFKSFKLHVYSKHVAHFEVGGI